MAVMCGLCVHKAWGLVLRNEKEVKNEKRRSGDRRGGERKRVEKEGRKILIE